jgi:hypothetical protein
VHHLTDEAFVKKTFFPLPLHAKLEPEHLTKHESSTLESCSRLMLFIRVNAQPQTSMTVIKRFIMSVTVRFLVNFLKSEEKWLSQGGNAQSSSLLFPRFDSKTQLNSIICEFVFL